MKPDFLIRFFYAKEFHVSLDKELDKISIIFVTP